MPAPLPYGYHRRLDHPYPAKPWTGSPLPPGTPVHYIDAGLFVACRIRGSGVRPKTRVPEKVTCPAFLKLLNLAHPKQPPCGSTTGATGPSVDPAHEREQADHHHARSSFGGSPASVSAGAGFLLG